MRSLKVLGALLVASVSSTPDDEASLMQLRVAQKTSQSSTVCTGDAEVDAWLAKPNFQAATKLSDSEVYTWAGFCSAADALAKLGKGLFTGTPGDPHRAAKVVTNIASLFAQCMWESGGDVPWSACDENNHLKESPPFVPHHEAPFPEASCTQRTWDWQRYDSLIGQSAADQATACPVDLDMSVTASTAAEWTSGKLECTPGTVTKGCCWWGRGAIQTTGPFNYGKLQKEVVDKSSSPDLAGVDLCANPGQLCTNSAMKWLAGLYYWTDAVQPNPSFEQSLHRYVASGFNEDQSWVGGGTFNDGTGGMVNHGTWDHLPHAPENRKANFKALMTALQLDGLKGGSETFARPVAAHPACDCAAGIPCFVAAWSNGCHQWGSTRAACAAAGGGTGEWIADITCPKHAGCDCADNIPCYVESWGEPCHRWGTTRESCASSGGTFIADLSC